MKGYIQIELGGVNRGVKFGNRALLDIMAKHKIEAGIEFTFALIADLVYYGLLNNCMVKREDPNFTFEDVNVWCDDITNEDMMNVFNTFVASYTGNVEETKPTKTNATKKK
jgi:hypothetical protein